MSYAPTRQPRRPGRYAPRARLTLTILWLTAVAAATVPIAARTAAQPRLETLQIDAPQLARQVRLWIYLPPDAGRGQRYPVVYMQDGQDLFEQTPLDASTFNPYVDRTQRREPRSQRGRDGTWGLDRRLERLSRRDRFAGVIVVGVSSDGDDDGGEYSPWPWHYAPRPAADRYLRFLVETLKPYIDNRYPTLPGREATAIAGSSMGGLLALYGGVSYPQIFSRIAALSPVLTESLFGRKLSDHITAQGYVAPQRIYADLGSVESGFGPLRPVYRALRLAGFDESSLWFREVPGGAHRPEHWGLRFPAVLRWLYPER